jgi:glutamate-ammonia-ligase adenylyltransferase
LPEDYKRLQKAQTFLRWLIEALRVVRGNARDVTIPAFGSDEFSFLGRRLCYSSDLADLKEEMARVSATVRELNARLLG